MFLLPPLKTEIPIGMWRLEENEEYFKDYIPAIEYDKVIAKYSNKSKKIQSLSARMALIQLLKEIKYSNDFINTFEIEKLDNGAPYINNLDYYITFTHTKSYAVAAISKETIPAIDVELIDMYRSLQVSEMFMSEKEKIVLRSINDRYEKRLFFFLVWCAKECMFKYLNRFMNEISFQKNLSIEIEAINMKESNGTFNSWCKKGAFNIDFKIFYFVYDSHIFVYLSK